MARRGALIAFEGLDQSGKQTQARRLRGRLEAAGRRVRTLTFPNYETPVANEIARALAGDRDYAADVLQLLFVANRYESRPRIEHWIDEGVVVICDRYLASSVAYGAAQGLDAAWLYDVQRRLPQPDLTLLLDIAPETAVTRKATGRDRFERDLDLLTRVRAAYRAQAGHPGWVSLDGERAADDVEHDVVRIVRERLALL